MLVAPLNEAVPLRLFASDGDTSLFGRIHIYNASGSLIANLTLSHIAEGLYGANWTPTVEGIYASVGQLFLDAGFTVDAGYDRDADDIDVSTMKASVIRLLGLVQENTVIDQQGYDVGGNLTTARIRTYNSKTNALAAGVTGIVAQYTMTAIYSSGQLVDYKVVRDS
jgi:hypothetical protein